MFDFLDRSKMVYGEKAVEALANARICLLGLGGVGSYCGEAFVRSGIGHITVADKDAVDISNINRQLVALRSTVGMSKTEVFYKRAKDINPMIEIERLDMFYIDGGIDFTAFDYVADAIDNVTAKINIAAECELNGVNLISAMGCGNRTQPEMLKTADIYETSGCPLCKVMRKELKGRGVKALKVVYSTETPKKPLTENLRTPGSTAFVPAAAGIMMAAAIVNDIVLNQ